MVNRSSGDQIQSIVMAATPDTVLASGDPGDETARRYSYQWTYAAVCCCALLDNTLDVVEVYCEHHEDVLLKHADGTFSGLQVKTRGTDQNQWKCTDEAVLKSCARFAKLEAAFPARFRSFGFLTNHPMFVGGIKSDLRAALASIATHSTESSLSGAAKSFLKRVADEAGCDISATFRALSKMHVNDSLPRLQDCEMRLMDSLSSLWKAGSECTHSQLKNAARQLIWECGRSSSLAHEDALPAYLPITSITPSEEVLAAITAKRMQVNVVLEILQRGLATVAALESHPESLIEPGAGTDDLLAKKLDAGGFSEISRNSAKNLRDHADYLGLVWIQKLGRTEGLQRHGHIRALVLSDAATAFENTKHLKDPFGSKMLDALRTRLEQRRCGSTQLYDCSIEHLEGFAYSLTSECQVQWSIDRPWEKKDA